MATAKLLFVSVALLVCAVAAVDKSTTTVNPSPTVVPHSLTTKGPTPTPTPTPTPAPSQYNFSNLTDRDRPCRIRMNGTMAWDFTYINSTDNTKKSVTEKVVNAKVLDSKSSCVYRESALLVLQWSGTDNETRLLTFNFTAGNTRRSKHWKLQNVTLAFNITERAFPDYPSGRSTNGTVYSDKVIDNTNSDVEYQRSYLCNTTRTLDFKNINDKINDIAMNVSLNITHFRIQAFDFKEPNSTTSAYGNARICPSDATGKKIVPIAVGIALGVLVIAVIVAFFISKIVNRKKSGYEALN